MIRLAILGCGNIGRFVISNLGKEQFKEFRLTAIAGQPSEEAVLREFALRHGCSYTCDPTTLADRKYDLVLEATHPDAVRQYAPMILRAGVNMVAMSVGAFADLEFLAEARAAAKDGNVRLLLPTGAIAGLDNLKAAALVGIEEASLTMTKSPKALVGAPYFEAHPIGLFAIREPTLVFEGTAAEAIGGFPQNVNVAVALSLATLGPDRTKLRVVCDPKASQITVDIYARGATGELRMQMVNLPSPDNPKTSYQACCSALATLLRFSDHVQVGS